ncbi:MULTISPECIES: YfbM family protein [Actinomadura]|uniref:YfbM family protein n=1 Tax=Actinomadura yumaensis TaxID=111807 RepID=A0ABW2CPN8_9ACTN|nr:YfbM family protein [Actinomadura sp. J1-007]MWK36752.1 DUF1877 family protein [Actinomadura sp. J1-007]
MSFTRVTQQELKRGDEDPQWLQSLIDSRMESSEGTLDTVGLDKAWAGIQYLLDAADVGIELQIDGSFLDAEGMNGWDPEEVKEAADLLRKADFETLAVHYDPADMDAEDVYPGTWKPRGDTGLHYLREPYEALVRFFNATADRNEAAVMTFSF